MKIEHRYRWRILWAGRWCTTSYYATEDKIRIEHPEAVRVGNVPYLQQIYEPGDAIPPALSSWPMPGSAADRAKE